MDRETRIEDMAQRLGLLIAEQGLEAHQIPDEPFTILVRGRLDLKALAEWFYVRML